MILVPVADERTLDLVPRAATIVPLPKAIWELPPLALNLRVASLPTPLLPVSPMGTT